VGTVYRPTNWQEKAVKVTINGQEKDGFEIINTGKMPWMGQNTDVKIKLNNTLITSAYVLDQSGYISKEIFVERNYDHIILSLPPNTMYMVLNTNEPTVVTGINDEDLSPIKLYPNPTKGTVVLDIPDHIKSLNSLQVYDNMGRLVHTEKNIRQGQKQIVLPALPNGIYHVTFNNSHHKKSSFKLLIQN
jgi:hypothetical protein